VLDQFAQALAKTIAEPAVRQRLTGWGLEVAFMTGPQLAEREAAYSKVWAEIVRKSGFQPQ
jgi:tripartite-type tricarboxylate transporter receptor subunit TctC